MLVLLHVPSPTLWVKTWIRHKPHTGRIQPRVSPSSTASGLQNTWQGLSRSGVTVPRVAVVELPVHPQQSLITLHCTGDAGFQGSRWSCPARGPAGAMMHQAPGRPNNDMSQSHAPNSEALSSCARLSTQAASFLPTM